MVALISRAGAVGDLAILSFITVTMSFAYWSRKS